MDQFLYTLTSRVLMHAKEMQFALNSMEVGVGNDKVAVPSP